MALSDAQKHDVVMYLGWSGKSIVVGSTNYNSQVADRLNNLTVEIEEQVQRFLDRLSSIDEKLESATCRLAAKRVDEIELNPDEIRMLKLERTRLSRLLGELLDIRVVSKNGVNVGICV